MKGDGAASPESVVNGDERRSALLQRARAKLERDLCPLVFDALKNPKWAEVMRNPDSRLWHERLGERMRQIGNRAASLAAATIRSITVNHAKAVTRRQPLRESELSLDGSRFAGQVPPVIGAPGFAIRHRAIAVTLPNCVELGIMTASQCGVIQAPVRARKNIPVSAGTGTGKTTQGYAVALPVKSPACLHQFRWESAGEIICETTAVRPHVMKWLC